MQPNQNPYDFITNQSQAPKQPVLGGGDTKSRLLKVAIFGAVFLILAFLFFQLVFGNKQSTAEILIKPAAQQADLIAMTAIGTEKVRDSRVNHLLTTANLILQSQNSQTLEIIKKGDGKVNEKTLKPYQDSKYEELLTEAEAGGKYEEVYNGLYQNKLDAYRTNLESAYNSLNGKNQEKIAEMYKQLDALDINQDGK